MTDQGEVFPGDPIVYQPSSQHESNWAVVLHLSTMAGVVAPLAGFLVPFTIWLLKKGESPYLNQQGKEVMNFLISIVIASAACGLLAMSIIGIPLAVAFGIALAIATIVLPILAAVRTSEGRAFRYPWIMRLLK